MPADATREVPIRGEMIRLGQLLKLAGLGDTGSDIKRLLTEARVLVNDEHEERRGRQLAPGDRVLVGGLELRVTRAPG